MNRLAKPAFALAALFVASTLAAGSASAADVNGALQYMPKNFTVSMHIDMAHVRKAPLFAAVKKMAGEMAPEMEQFKKATAFDAFNDIQGITVAGPDGLMRNGEEMLMVIEARYNTAKLVDFIKSQLPAEAVVEKASPAGKYYEINGEGAIAFHGSFIVVGPTSLFGQGMAAKNGKNATSGDLGKLAKKFSTSKAGFVVTTSSFVSKQLASEMPEFADFTTGGMGVDLSGGGLMINVVANLSKVDSASQLATKLGQGLKDGAKDPGVVEVGLKSAFANAKVSAKGKSVNVAMSLSKTELRKVQDMMMGMFN